MIPGPCAAVLIVCVLIPIALVATAPTAPTAGRRRGPTWFDLLPYMTQSKKARGRAQQRRRTHRG